MRTYSVIVAVALGIGMQAANAAPRGYGMQEQPAASASDAAFLKQAVINNRAAVAEGNLVLQKTSNEHVKQVAQTVVETHTKMLEQLERESASAGVSIPEGPGAASAQRLSRAKALDGKALDRQFIHDMVQLHTSELHVYQAEAAHGHDEALKSLSQNEVTTIQQHLGDLRSLEKGGL